MKITEILNSKKPTVSFEIFPPKTEEAKESLEKNLKNLQALHPSFISVTMGAMGTDPGNTFQIVQTIEEEYRIPAVAHFTCVASSRPQVAELLKKLPSLKISNLLCLRGDAPKGSSDFQPPADGFHYASELIEFVRQQSGDSFSIGGAAYPEGHPESLNRHQDLLHLKTKVDAGADYLITQLFFNNEDYFNFVESARALGIRIPILPGIMPVTNFSQLKRFTQMCGASIPDEMQQALEKIAHDPQATKEYGVEYAARQCRELLKHQVPGIHFYVLNQADSVQKILQQIEF